MSQQRSAFAVRRMYTVTVNHLQTESEHVRGLRGGAMMEPQEGGLDLEAMEDNERTEILTAPQEKE